MTKQEQELMKNFKVEVLEERLEMWGGGDDGCGCTAVQEHTHTPTYR